MKMDFRFSNFDFGMKRGARRGFSFTEVMFAVILLGLGFIMVAAIFPVAIRQSQANMEDTAGVSVAKAGGAVMESMGAALRTTGATGYTYHVNVDPLLPGQVATPLH